MGTGSGSNQYGVLKEWKNAIQDPPPERPEHSYQSLMSASTEGMYTYNPSSNMLINPRCACAARVTVVVLCACVSVKSKLTSGASVRPENTTYSAGKGGQKMWGFL